MTDDLVKRLRSKKTFTCETGSSHNQCVNPDGPEAADRIEALEAERDAAIREMSAWAREAGEAKGRLEASEMAGVVEGWKERAEAAEARLQMAVDALGKVTPILETYVQRVPLGHQPHMMAHKAEEAVARARSTLQAIRGQHHG